MSQGKQQGQTSRGGGNYGNPQYNQGGNQKKKKDEKDWQEEYKKTWGKQFEEILKPEKSDYGAYINTMKTYVQGKHNISASQLRNIFYDVRKVQKVSELYMIRPKLAYAAGRSDKDEVKEVMVLFDELIAQVKTQEQLKAFQDFFEAIIAYHKFYGGKD